MSYAVNPTKYEGVSVSNPPGTIRAARAPLTTDLNFPFNTIWIDTANDDVYLYSQSAAGSATWVLMGASSDPIADVAHGGTGLASITDHGVVVGSGTDPVTPLAVGTSGQLLVGSSGADPVFATPTSSDSSVTFTLGAGTISAHVNPIQGSFQYADVTITAAQVKALATTPIELVAAPAAGNAILFLGAMFKLNYGSEVFAEAGDNLGIKFTDATGVQVSDTIETTGFIDQSADTITNAVPVKDAIVAAASAEAQALVLDNLGSNITGNASNDSTVSVRVYYTYQAL